VLVHEVFDNLLKVSVAAVARCCRPSVLFSSCIPFRRVGCCPCVLW
jgi:hypothetical protein